MLDVMVMVVCYHSLSSCYKQEIIHILVVLGVGGYAGYTCNVSGNGVGDSGRNLGYDKVMTVIVMDGGNCHSDICGGITHACASEPVL